MTRNKDRYTHCAACQTRETYLFVNNILQGRKADRLLVGGAITQNEPCQHGLWAICSDDTCIDRQRYDAELEANDGGRVEDVDLKPFCIVRNL